MNVTFSERVGALEVSGTNVVSHDGIHAVLAPIGSSTPEDVVRALISRFPVVNIGVVETNLEDVMRDVYLSTLDESKNDERDGDQLATEDIHRIAPSGVTAVQVSTTVTHPHRSWRILRIGLLNERPTGCGSSSLPSRSPCSFTCMTGSGLRCLVTRRLRPASRCGKR